MPLYEHVFLARQDLSQAQVDALAENATKIVEENQGKVVKTETWGLRSLAYKIQKNRKALVAFYEDYLRGLKAVLDPKNCTKVLETVAKVAGSPVKNFEEWALLEGKDYYHSPDGKINAKALQNNINSLKELGLLKQTLDVAPHIDNSLLDEAAKRQ